MIVFKGCIVCAIDMNTCPAAVHCVVDHPAICDIIQVEEGQGFSACQIGVEKRTVHDYEILSYIANVYACFRSIAIDGPVGYDPGIFR